ncbi:protein YgfX [Dyella tabacisoli]|uniref:Toxin CptA n=1 Tax=Dyella tabacisoli TaxID=2282381 RepID=A0A369UM11_9GAMM|nr:protein YgfX [Dyella tabacisoli]RDD81125.1 hypothetical protein DVJ77_12395 [Dyella tabacisoli]
MTSAPAIGFEYRPSRWFLRLLSVVALLAALAIALCGLPWWSKCLLLIATFVVALRAIRRTLTRRVIAAGWAGDGGWSLRMAEGADATATLASFRAMGVFILLRLVLPGQRPIVLVLAPDNCDADTRRRLRMRLAAIKPGEALPRL